MPRILVLVPFPLDEHNLSPRREQGRSVALADETVLD